MARPEPGAVPRRPHHISSIAHLFLDEDGAPEPSPVVREVAVAAPGTSPVSAFAAAGLAVGSNRPATVSEGHQIRWSAGTYLAGEKVPDRKGAQRNNWTIFPDQEEGSPGNGVGQSKSDMASPILWNHLGCLGPTGMAHLESLSVGHSLVDLSLDGSGGLVWCLLAREADRIAPSYILGRLVEMIRPDRIWILMFPDAWAEAGRPGWLEKISRNDLGSHDPGDPARCAELVDRACGTVPLEIHRVRGENNLAASFNGKGRRDSIWHQVASGMAVDRS